MGDIFAKDFNHTSESRSIRSVNVPSMKSNKPELNFCQIG